MKRVAARAGVRLHGVDDAGRPIEVDSAEKNVSEVSPHTLRRTFGSDLLNRGVRIEVVSAQLGHASVKITEKAYAKLTTQTQRDELLRLVTGFPFLRGRSPRSRGRRGRWDASGRRRGRSTPRRLGLITNRILEIQSRINNAR